MTEKQIEILARYVSMLVYFNAGKEARDDFVYEFRKAGDDDK